MCCGRKFLLSRYLFLVINLICDVFASFQLPMGLICMVNLIGPRVRLVEGSYQLVVSRIVLMVPRLYEDQLLFLPSSNSRIYP